MYAFRKSGVAAALVGMVLLSGCAEVDSVLDELTSAASSAVPQSSTAPGESHVASDYYVVESTGNAIFSDACPRSGFNYEGIIDDEGRVGSACAVLTREVFMAEKSQDRDKISHLIPAGFTGNKKVDLYDPQGKVYKTDWFYNRSHLIADSLGGEGSLDNLITGTRPQNSGYSEGSGGMQYLEMKISKYLESTKGCPVTYEVTPNYSPGEIVPRTVTVNAASCDNSINETVTVFNDAAGYTIDYTTGEWSANS